MFLTPYFSEFDFKLLKISLKTSLFLVLFNGQDSGLWIASFPKKIVSNHSFNKVPIFIEIEKFIRLRRLIMQY